MPPTTQQILRSYRRVYRASLHAVQYSSPARHVLRKLINNAYRSGTAADFDRRRIDNTVEFLDCAAEEKGLEHKIVKTLMHTWWDGGHTKMMIPNQRRPREDEHELRLTAFDHFEATLKMLNESMKMCLPTSVRAANRDVLRDLERSVD